MLLSDEVVFRHRGADGQDGQIRVPLAVGLLFAANAMRTGEQFALGYPDDPIGGIARGDGERLFVHRDAAGTLSEMRAFLDRYTEVLIEQTVTGEAAGRAADAAETGDSGSAAPPGAVENISPTAA